MHVDAVPCDILLGSSRIAAAGLAAQGLQACATTAVERPYLINKHTMLSCLATFGQLDACSRWLRLRILAIV